MSNIQVTIDYSIDGEPEPHPAHTTVPMLSPWVLALLAVSMGVMAMRRRG
jgi:hypothetical protein